MQRFRQNAVKENSCAESYNTNSLELPCREKWQLIDTHVIETFADDKPHCSCVTATGLLLGIFIDNNNEVLLFFLNTI